MNIPQWIFSRHSQKIKQLRRIHEAASCLVRAQNLSEMQNLATTPQLGILDAKKTEPSRGGRIIPALRRRDNGQRFEIHCPNWQTSITGWNHDERTFQGDLWSVVWPVPSVSRILFRMQTFRRLPAPFRGFTKRSDPGETNSSFVKSTKSLTVPRLFGSQSCVELTPRVHLADRVEGRESGGRGNLRDRRRSR